LKGEIKALAKKIVYDNICMHMYVVVLRTYEWVEFCWKMLFWSLSDCLPILIVNVLTNIIRGEPVWLSGRAMGKYISEIKRSRVRPARASLKKEFPCTYFLHILAHVKGTAGTTFT
jgi:hypothetical protein